MNCIGLHNEIGTVELACELASVEMRLSGTHPEGALLDESSLHVGMFALNLYRRGALLFSPRETVDLFASKHADESAARKLLVHRMLLCSPDGNTRPPLAQHVNSLGFVLYHNNHYSLLMCNVAEWLGGGDDDDDDITDAPPSLNMYYIDTCASDEIHGEARHLALQALSRSDFMQLAGARRCARALHLVRLPCAPTGTVSRHMSGLYTLVATALLASHPVHLYAQASVLLNDEFISRVRNAIIVPIVRTLRAWNHTLCTRHDEALLMQPVYPSTLYVGQITEFCNEFMWTPTDSYPVYSLIAALVCAGVVVFDNAEMLQQLSKETRLCVLLVPSVIGRDEYKSARVNDIGLIVMGRVASTGELVARYYSRARADDATHFELFAVLARFKVNVRAHHSLSLVHDSMLPTYWLLEYIGNVAASLCTHAVDDPVEVVHKNFYTQWFAPSFGNAAAAVAPPPLLRNIPVEVFQKQLSQTIAASLWYSICAQELAFRMTTGTDANNNSNQSVVFSLVPYEPCSTRFLRGGSLALATRTHQVCIGGHTLVPTEVCAFGLNTVTIHPYVEPVHTVQINNATVSQLLSTQSNSTMTYWLDTALRATLEKELYTERVRQHCARLMHHTVPVSAMSLYEDISVRMTRVWTHALAHRLCESLRESVRGLIESLVDMNVTASMATSRSVFEMFCVWPVMWVDDRTGVVRIALDAVESASDQAIRELAFELSDQCSAGRSDVCTTDTYENDACHVAYFPVYVETCTCHSTCTNPVCSRAAAAAADDTETRHTTIVSVDTAYRMAMYDEFVPHKQVIIANDRDYCGAVLSQCTLNRLSLHHTIHRNFRRASSSSARDSGDALADPNERFAPGSPAALAHAQSNMSHITDALSTFEVSHAQQTRLVQFQHLLGSACYVPRCDKVHIPRLRVSLAAFESAFK